MQTGTCKDCCVLIGNSQQNILKCDYSDPGGGQKEKDPESELESLIMRVGEKVIFVLTH